MLNIFNVKLKKSKSKDITNEYKGNDLGLTRHYPPANKEWFNSIYAYNKNTSKLLPIADKVLSKLTKNYFNLYSVKLEKKIKSRRVRKWSRRLSTNRILISKAELKHTSDKVIITIYVYNRQEKNHLKKMRKINIISKVKKDKRSFISKIRLIKRQALVIVTRVRKEKNLLLKTFKWENNQYKNYEKQYSKNFIVKSLEKEMLYLYLKQIIFFNKSKFENTYLLPLTNLVQKVYNKKVEFNLVNLKYLHLNSHIFTESIATKLRNRKNKLIKVLRASLRMVKIASLNKLAILEDISKRQKIIQNLKVNLLLSDPFLSVFLFPLKGNEEKKNRERQNKDDLELIIERLFFFVLGKNKKKKSLIDLSSKEIVNTVLNSIKHKPVSGIRIEAAGRLSRRIIAERSVFKLKYKGNLRNVDSSYKGFSSVILRGHAKSNLQYTKVKSKTRIGSFGLKGWISSY